MSRGERMMAERRKKAKCRRILKGQFVLPGEDLERKLSPKSVGKMAAAPHPCSERCCGNPRCHSKGKDRLTLQEVKAMIDDNG
jgi:hypothetical protein